MPGFLMIALGVAFSTTLAVATSLIGMATAAPTHTPQIVQGHAGTIIERRLTKAECLKKPGYIWIEQTGRCVKDHRGSH